MGDYPCHKLPKDQWCDHAGRGGFMGHTCVPTHNKPKLFLPIGMIGTSKSTWARQFILTNSNTKIVAGDDIRFMLGGGKYEHDEWIEPAVLGILFASTQTLLSYSYDVILDECYCSLTKAMRRRVVQLFCDHEIIAVVFPERDMKDHIEDKVIKGLRGKTVAYWKRVFTEMKAIYEPVCSEEELLAERLTYYRR